MTKQEIDRRIDDLVADALREAGDEVIASEPLQPRWISPAELVRRLRPFMVQN